MFKIQLVSISISPLWLHIMLDYGLQQIVEPELHANENLQWVGKPSMLEFAKQDLIQPLFGLVWMVALYFFFTFTQNMQQGFTMGRSSSSGFFAFFNLILFVFVLVGLKQVLTPVWNFVRGGRTVYGLTDRRAIIIEDVFRKSVKSYAAQDMQQIQRRGDDLRGDVIFGKEIHSYRDSKGRSRTRTVQLGFLGIDNPREVEQLLLQIKDESGDKG